MTKSQKPSPDKSIDRRRFFKTASVGAIGGAASLAIGSNESEAVAADPKATGDRSRYRETEHVRTAYRLARF